VLVERQRAVALGIEALVVIAIALGSSLAHGAFPGACPQRTATFSSWNQP
jgi:hypothetical protein